MGAVERSNNKIYTSKRPQDIPQSPQVPCFLGDTTTSSSIDQALVKLFQHKASLNRHDARNRVLCQPWVPLTRYHPPIFWFLVAMPKICSSSLLGNRHVYMYIRVYYAYMCIYTYIPYHAIPYHSIPYWHYITLHCTALHDIPLHYIPTYLHTYMHACIHTYHTYIHTLHTLHTLHTYKHANIQTYKHT